MTEWKEYKDSSAQCQMEDECERTSVENSAKAGKVRRDSWPVVLLLSMACYQLSLYDPLSC